MSARFSCARLALARDEPRFATASHVSRWLLVEQPGSWGSDAVFESALDRSVALALKARAAEIGARLLLIRPHGRSHGGPSRVIAASSLQAAPWAESLDLTSPADILDVDLTPLRAHRSVGGRRLLEPVHLVCTNGSHDACCAEFGRPLARVVDAICPGRAWECSHIGGDRFAGNLVCLPEGVYYGHVGPLAAPSVVTAHEDGLVDLEHYRGRSCMPFVAQAADYFVRRERGILRLGGLRVERQQEVAPGTWDVWLTEESGTQLRCGVTENAEPRPQQLTCAERKPAHPPRYELVAIEVIGGR